MCTVSTKHTQCLPVCTVSTSHLLEVGSTPRGGGGVRAKRVCVPKKGPLIFGSLFKISFFPGGKMFWVLELVGPKRGHPPPPPAPAVGRQVTGVDRPNSGKWTNATDAPYATFVPHHQYRRFASTTCAHMFALCTTYAHCLHIFAGTKAADAGQRSGSFWEAAPLAQDRIATAGQRASASASSGDPCCGGTGAVPRGASHGAHHGMAWDDNARWGTARQYPTNDGSEHPQRPCGGSAATV